jgi:aryl-alcohol dehydrogenase-like predicted oxidoreductase
MRLARPLCTTGLTTSILGLGGGRICSDNVSGADVDRLAGAALDAGVTLIDTARSYGLSEERLGRALAGRREGLLLSTKVGYGAPSVPDWTGEVITAGVDAALRRLRTDRLGGGWRHARRNREPGSAWSGTGGSRRWQARPRRSARSIYGAAGPAPRSHPAPDAR